MSVPRLTSLRTLATLLRTYRVRGLLRRTRHELRCRRGAFRVAPRVADIDQIAASSFAYRPAALQADNAKNTAHILERGRKVADGYYQAFSDSWLEIPSGDNWCKHPVSGFTFAQLPWWRVPLLPAGNDVKAVWEPARFGWVYDLVRAYAVSGDASFARAFYRHARDFCDSNPPYLGPHWACGQETGIRALAVLHGLDSLPASDLDGDTRDRLVTLLGWSGERIDDAIEYGLSQRNNHGISESASLIHLGLRLSGRHVDAERWLRRGTRLIEEQIKDQFYADGWYAQHSFNYMRVALEQALYAQHVLLAAGTGLADSACARLDAATGLLTFLIDSESGEMPNHGANDGARILPLSAAKYRDFRPLLTMAMLVRNTALPADVRPDSDTLQWMGGVASQVSPARGDGVLRGQSGWVAARVGDCSVFMFAGTYRHRPSHLDALHLHVRIDGREVIADPGTYSYNANEPWNNSLTAARVHNAPVIDHREPGERGPRFLWLSWPKARIVEAASGTGYARIVAERPKSVRREVTVHSQGVNVVDEVLDFGADALEVCWLLHPDAGPDFFVTAEGARMLEAKEGDVRGWFSPTYGLRVASRFILVERRSSNGIAGIETHIGRKA